MPRNFTVLAIEPYYGLSHRMFLDGYRTYSKHDVEIWHLPARKWKWRMRGSAMHFADVAAERCSQNGDVTSEASGPPDVILASDFLNLADWKAQCPPAYRDVPCVLYFHENQIAYPVADHAPQEHFYGWINLSSALAADDVLFNSAYQREGFIFEVDQVLQRMPDHIPRDVGLRLRAKSGVFPVGIDFAPHDELLAARTAEGAESGISRSPGRVLDDPPTILWNHRWEWDKDPDAFVDALLHLAGRGIDFRVVVCGESFGRSHPAFERLSAHIGSRLRHLGFVASAAEYRELACTCDIVVSTARHEFFGVSVVEAIHLGCLPALPSRLSYPEIVPAHLHPLFLCPDGEPFPSFLERFVRHPPVEFFSELRDAMGAYDWRRLAPALDDHLAAVAARSAHRMRQKAP